MPQHEHFDQTMPLSEADRDFLSIILRAAFRNRLRAIRVGSSPSDDALFRLLVDELIRNAKEHGCPSVSAYRDDLWAFAVRAFEQQRKPFGGKNTVVAYARSTINRIIQQSWVQSLHSKKWVETVDQWAVRKPQQSQATQSDEGATERFPDPAEVTIDVDLGNEASTRAPLYIRASVRNLRLTCGSLHDVLAPESPNDEAWLPGLHALDPPVNGKLRVQLLKLLCHRLRQIKPDNPPPARSDALHQFRAATVAAEEVKEPSDELLLLLREQLTQLSNNSSSFDFELGASKLRAVLPDDPEREAHEIFELAKRASAVARKTILAVARLAVKATLILVGCSLIAALLILAAPVPDLHGAVVSFFERTVTTLLHFVHPGDPQALLSPSMRPPDAILGQSDGESWIEVRNEANETNLRLVFPNERYFRRYPDTERNYQWHLEIGDVNREETTSRPELVVRPPLPEGARLSVSLFEGAMRASTSPMTVPKVPTDGVAVVEDINGTGTVTYTPGSKPGSTRTVVRFDPEKVMKSYGVAPDRPDPMELAFADADPTLAVLTIRPGPYSERFHVLEVDCGDGTIIRSDDPRTRGMLRPVAPTVRIDTWDDTVFEVEHRYTDRRPMRLAFRVFLWEDLERGDRTPLRGFEGSVSGTPESLPD